MARIRTIKPEINSDRKAQALEDSAWRLWVSMWTIADDLGRLPCDVAFLAGQFFWGRPDSIEHTSRALARLRESSMLEFYEVNGEPYALIRGWKKHQKIDRPSGPKFPGPDQAISSQLLLQIENPREPSRSLDPDHDRDHDRDHDPDQAKQNTNEPRDRDRSRDVGDGPVDNSVSSDDASELPPQASPETENAAPVANENGQAKRKREPPEIPDQALTLAHLLLDRIIQNNPTGRVANTPERRRPEMAQRWAVTIDKLHRLDGQSWGAIEGMIVWCQRDSFWRGVILGADNLRDKWDKMTLQRERQHAPRVSTTAKRGPTELALEELQTLEGKVNP